MANIKLTKKETRKMTREELLAVRAELEVLANTEEDQNNKNIMLGSIGLIDVELAQRPEETVTEDVTPEGTDAEDVKPEETTKTELVVQISPEEQQAIRDQIEDILVDRYESVNLKWAKILKLAEATVDPTTLPYEYCSDAELLRRLKLLWSKRVAANKKGDQSLLDEIEIEERLINSYRNAHTNRTGVVSSSEADPSKLDQAQLQKLIRNYQSKKCNAKKQLEAAQAAGDQESIDLWESQMNHWQKKVDDASKYRTSTPAAQKTVELTKAVKDMIAALEPFKDNPAVAAQIAKLTAQL